MKAIQHVSSIDGPQTNGKKVFKKIIKTIIAAIIILTIFLLLIFTGQIIFFFQIFGWLQHQVRNFTGADMLVANGIAALLVAIISVIPFWAFLKSFLPLPQEHKKLYRITSLVFLAMIFFSLYFSSQNVFFNPDTGEPLKYYSIAPDGKYKFYSSGGYDAVTGDTLKKVAKDIILSYLKQTKGNPKFEKGAESEKSAEIGVEKLFHTYRGKIINQTNATIIFATSTDLVPAAPSRYRKVSTLNLSDKPPDLNIIKVIRPDNSAILDLVEGKHYFALFNVNGENIFPNTIKETYFSILDTDGATKPLLETISCWPVHWCDIGNFPDSLWYRVINPNDGWFQRDYRDNKGLYPYEKVIYGPRLDFNDQNYTIKTAYSLHIHPRDNWKLYIKNNSLLFAHY